MAAIFPPVTVKDQPHQESHGAGGLQRAEQREPPFVDIHLG
jgi:hypothetical protein